MKGSRMAKIEISVTDAEKAALRFAADRENLRLATWAKAKLMGLAERTMPVQITRNDGADT